MSDHATTVAITPSEGPEGEEYTTGNQEIISPKTLPLEIPESEGPSGSIASLSSSPISGDEDIIDSRPPIARTTSTSTTPSATPSSSSSCTTTSSTSNSSLLLANDDGPVGGTLTRAPTLNVKFAPLPELAPRKRRSSVPLGMAARSQLVRRRRGYQDPDPGPRYNAGNNPMWTEEELAQARMQQVATAVKERQRREEGEGERGRVANNHGDPNDPLLVLGRKMKDASKQIWKKVSKKDMKKDKENLPALAAAVSSSSSSEGEAQQKPKNGSVNGSLPQDYLSSDERTEMFQEIQSDSSNDSSSTPTPSKPATPLRSILIPPQPIVSKPRGQFDEHVEEVGGVWEEEIDPHFPLHASQSESSFDDQVLPPLVPNRRSTWIEKDLPIPLLGPLDGFTLPPPPSSFSEQSPIDDFPTPTAVENP